MPLSEAKNHPWITSNAKRKPKDNKTFTKEDIE